MILTIVLIAASWIYFSLVLLGGRFSIGNSELKLRLKICLFLMLLFGIFSCCAQTFFLMNLTFLATHASAIMILFILGPQLMAKKNKDRFLNFVLVPLVVIAVLSISIFAGNRDNGRLQGLYGNAIIAGQMFGITSILLFWKILYHSKEKTKLLWFLFIVSMLGLLITRTRTDIAGLFVGITVCLSVAFRHTDMEMSRKRAKRLVLVFMPLSIAVLFWIAAAKFELSPVRQYLRLGENVKETIKDRQVYWERGLERITINNIFGNGPLDKFGDDVSLSRSNYDIDSNAHNALLSVVQYYGWPGGLLFVLFLIVLFSVFLSRRDSHSILGISILAFGVVQCISENWLLSFGTPLDLYSWFLLGWCLSGRNYKSDLRQIAISPGTSSHCLFWGHSGPNKKVINVY